MENVEFISERGGIIVQQVLKVIEVVKMIIIKILKIWFVEMREEVYVANSPV